MSISELVNNPQDFKIGDKTYKVSRLSLSEYMATAEDHVLSNYRKVMDSIAKMLTGKEKIDYLVQAGKETPDGAELNRLAVAWGDSMDGHKAILRLALNKHQTINDEQIMELMSEGSKPENAGQLELLGKFLSGIKDTPVTETVEKKA